MFQPVDNLSADDLADQMGDGNAVRVRVDGAVRGREDAAAVDDSEASVGRDRRRFRQYA
jgi:hypothetical protein